MIIPTKSIVVGVNNLKNRPNFTINPIFIIRGLFLSGKGIKINADVNGAMNIMKKVVPTALDGKGIEAMVLSP